jgi:hypothetical protein
MPVLGVVKRGLKRHRSARILATGHAFVQNLRRGHYELATDVAARHLCVPRISSTALASRVALSGRLPWQPEICGPPVKNGPGNRISQV